MKNISLGYLDERNFLAHTAKKKRGGNPDLYSEYLSFIQELRTKFSNCLTGNNICNTNFLLDTNKEAYGSVWTILNDCIREFLENHKIFLESLGIENEDIDNAFYHKSAHGLNRLVKKMADALVVENAEQYKINQKKELGKKKKSPEKKDSKEIQYLKNLFKKIKKGMTMGELRKCFTKKYFTHENGSSHLKFKHIGSGTMIMVCYDKNKPLDAKSATERRKQIQAIINHLSE